MKDIQRSLNEKFEQVRTECTNFLEQITQNWVAKFERRLEQSDQKVAELKKIVKATVHQQEAMQDS